ncbi:MAG: hypothetical protein IJ526_11230, partial [Lachnospiraceae bacterium]|nr:hypothetical protein [Lachnospiraceae bacterium]
SDYDKKNEFDIEKYVKNLCHAVVKPDDKMDAAFEYDAETGKIEQVKLYEMLSPEIRKRICCFVDDNANCLCKRNGKLVLSKDAFREKFSHCTAILLSSYEHIKELREEAFHGVFGTCEIIDIYKLFDEKGIRYEKDFYYALYESDYQEAIRNMNEGLCV